MPRVVLLFDDDGWRWGEVESCLARRGYGAVRAADAEAAFESALADGCEAVICDLDAGGVGGGLLLCGRLNSSRPELPVVLTAREATVGAAVEALRVGAADFLEDPDPDEAADAVSRAVQRRGRTASLRRGEPGAAAGSDLFGDCEAMVEVRRLLERLAASDVPVLLFGEPGTGKEAAARALHRRGRRGQGPFVAVDCAAAAEPLLERELFGFDPGRRPDAHDARPGALREAHGGTLFLDEVGALPWALQPKLLRALQERTVRPSGGGPEVAFDVRVIAASSQDLERAVEEGRFRKDLFFAIHVVSATLPPLRERGADVLALAQHFAVRCAARSGKRVEGLSAAAAERLLGYPWPGNVRELQNAIERAVALTRFERLAVEDLPDRLAVRRPARPAGAEASSLEPLEEVERRHILRVLEASGGNKTLAARVLGLDRKTLYRKLDRYLVEVPSVG